MNPIRDLAVDRPLRPGAHAWAPGPRRRPAAGPGRRGGARRPESRRLTHAQRMIALRVSLVLSLVILLIGAIVYGVVRYAQHADAERETLWAVRHNTTASPPVCVFMIIERDGVVTETPGTPAGLPVASGMAAVRAGSDQVLQHVVRGGEHYTVRTARRGPQIVQAAYGEKYQRADRRHLLLALGTAESVGLLLVAFAAARIARRSMLPLAQALERQRRFVADASHELRTPLTQLHTRAQLLARRSGAAGPGELTAGLERMVAGTRLLGDVIDDLLLSARLDGSPAAREPVDLGVLAAAAVAAEDVRAQARGLTLRVRCAPGPHVVTGSASALRRVVASLLDNALGHTPEGGHVTVSVQRPAADTVSLSVRDTGVGFAPAEAERIFERFARGTSGQGRRFGLGLALAREVVEAHRGRIAAEGRPGAGATFVVELPAARAEAAARHRPPAAALPPPACGPRTAAGHGGRIGCPRYARGRTGDSREQPESGSLPAARADRKGP